MTGNEEAIIYGQSDRRTDRNRLTGQTPDFFDRSLHTMTGCSTSRQHLMCIGMCEQNDSSSGHSVLEVQSTHVNLIFDFKTKCTLNPMIAFQSLSN